MKKNLTILFIVFCPVCYMQAMDSQLAVVNAAPDSAAAAKGAREIRIIETTTNSGPLRSAPAPVVSAWLVGSQISLTFLQDLGTVTVTITVTGAQNEVYQASVPATDGTEITISTQGWPAGAYTITIVRSSGQTLTGDFEL